MASKKIFLTVIMIFTLQNMLATTYICRLDASLTERKFFDLCLSCNAESLRIFLDQQKALLSEIDFKKLINMTAENDRSMLTMLIKKSFAEEKALDLLMVLVSYEPDIYLGSLLPLDVVINTYLIYAVFFKQDSEKSSWGVMSVLGILEKVPYHLQVSLFILDLLKDLKQDFNYKNRNEQPALHKLVENRLRRQEITKSDLILIDKLLQLGADPTIKIGMLLEHEITSAVDLVYYSSCFAENKNVSNLYELFKKYGYYASWTAWTVSNCVIL